MTKPKRSWPLLLLAACAFIPGFGVFFGAAAVTWGLVSDRPRAMRAVAIAAAGALLNLIGGAVLVWRLEQGQTYAAASTASSRADLRKLVAAIEGYRTDTGHYPARLAVFTQLPYSLKLINTTDFSAGVFSRPREYQYELASDRRTYALFGVGPDGEPNTADDVYPNLPDSVARRSGYRTPTEAGDPSGEPGRPRND
jgi:hypothetical protein